MEIKPGDDDCPYLAHPLPDCYNRELNSRSIPKMLQYCLNRHRSCPVRNAESAARPTQPCKEDSQEKNEAVPGGS